MDWGSTFVVNSSHHNASDSHNASSDPGHGSSIGSPWAGRPGDPDPPNIPMAVFLVLCMCISTIGNGAVLYIAVHKLKSTSFGRLNLLISSLALSDFLQVFSLMLPQLFKNVYGEWACGLLICKIHSALRSMQTNVSISILTIITLERFLYLDKLSDGSENKSMYIVINVLIWSVHIGLAVPLGIWSTVLWTPRMCTIPAKTISMTEEYVVIVKTIFFFIPLTIMWICNIGIIYKTRKSSMSVRPLQMNRQPQRAPSSRIEREKRTILTCLLLALVFTVTHVPFETCLFILKSASSRQQITQVTTMMSYLWPLTILNPCINPFIYSVFFREFRRRVKEMMRCAKCSLCSKVSWCKRSASVNVPTASSRAGQDPSPDTMFITSEYGHNPSSLQIISVGSPDVQLPHRTRHPIGNTLSPISIDT